MWFDTPSGVMYFDFTEDFGYVVAVDVKKARLAGYFAPQTDGLFPGFINMYGTKSALVGVTMTVSEDGFCSNGCLGYGTVGLQSQNYNAGQLIPFKAGMDDTHYLDQTANKFYLQGSYPLESQWFCSSDETDQCMLTLDGSSGALSKSVYTNYTVYKYSQQADTSGSLLAFVEGFDSTVSASVCGRGSTRIV